ncbi:hypothetical protein B9N49_00685 [Finegoldia magna]|uniref:Uncharacterized protein n=1 Tax=Finegoldia magna TaxID=1260 RepID=A0A233V9U9_FINMA|nr:hypothetical protein [Finegoldia magna]OXZ29171.1 hypothetical protein B9N49_00685 [Finegoldia magna]
MFKIERKEGKLEITTPYSSSFVTAIKKLGGKWNADKKVWAVDEEFEDKVNDLIIRIYNHDVTGKEKVITVEYNAKDFYNSEDVVLGKRITVYRPSRDEAVKLNKTIIIENDFPARGGSAKYPTVFEYNAEYDVTLRTDLYERYYNKLTDEEKEKVKIIKKESDRDALLREKEQLEKRLEEINKLLEEK